MISISRDTIKNMNSPSIDGTRSEIYDETPISESFRNTSLMHDIINREAKAGFKNHLTVSS